MKPSNDCKTGRQWGHYAKDHGAQTVEDWPGSNGEKIYIATHDNKALIIPAGELQPHASHSIGAIIKWMLRLALTLALLFGGYAWAIRL